MINFKMYSWSYSAGIVSYWYLHCTWKCKTYGNPVYITMIKHDQFQDVHLVLYCRCSLVLIPSLYMEI